MIDFTKPVYTRDGRRVTIFGTDFDADANFPVRGTVEGERPKTMRSWQSSGKYVGDGALAPLDLTNEQPRIKLTAYVNIYKQADGRYLLGGINYSPQLSGHPSQVACVKVDLDFVEGEGL